MTPAKKKPWLCSRRAFLGGLGAVGFSHLLPNGRLAHAQTGARKRFVVIYVPEGMWAGADRPAAGAPRSGSIFGPMDPFRSKITALDGFDLASAIADRPGVDEHHRLPHLLGCTKMVNGVTGGGPTIDQKIAKVVGANSTFESLQFGVQIVYTDGSGRPDLEGTRPSSCLPWRTPGMAYSRIFGGGMAPQPQPTRAARRRPGPPSSICARARSTTRWVRSPACSRAWRRAIGCAWSRTRTPCATSRSGCRAWAAVDAGGPAAGGAGRGACTPPNVGAPMDIKAKANFPKIAQLQMDLMVGVSSVRHHQRRQPAVSATRSTSAPIPGWGSAGAGTTCPTAAHRAEPAEGLQLVRRAVRLPPGQAAKPCRKAPAPCSTTRSCSGCPSSATARRTA